MFIIIIHTYLHQRVKFTRSLILVFMYSQRTYLIFVNFPERDQDNSILGEAIVV